MVFSTCKVWKHVTGRYKAAAACAPWKQALAMVTHFFYHVAPTSDRYVENWRTSGWLPRGYDRYWALREAAACNTEIQNNI